MTVKVITGGHAAAVPSGNSPYGALPQSLAESFTPPVWTPGVRGQAPEGDTLALPRFQVVNDVLNLAPGGQARLYQPYQTYYSNLSSLASLVTGPDSSTTAVGQPTVAASCLVLPNDGILPQTTWTIEFLIESVGADYTAQASATSYFLFIAADGSQTQRLQIYRTGTAGMTAALAGYLPGSGTVAFATVNLAGIASGTFPSNTWVPISCTFDGTNLNLYIGNNATGPLTGSTTVSHPRLILPWSQAQSSNGAGGVAVNGSWPATATATQLPFNVTAPHIRKYARVPQQNLLASTYLKGPTISINATGAPGKSLAPIGGAFAQYAGWRQAPGVADTMPTVRAAIIVAQAADGLQVVRIDHVFDRILINQSGTLSAGLSTGAPITSLPLTGALSYAVSTGDQIMVADSTSAHFQVFTASAPATSGPIAVNSQTPTFAFASGSVVVDINWGALDDQMGALSAAGISFHVTWGFTPPFLGGNVGGGGTAVPTYGGSTATGATWFAQLCLAALQHWATRGFSIRQTQALWNEPDGSY